MTYSDDVTYSDVVTYSDDVPFSAIINILNVTINWVLDEWKVSCFLD